MKAIEKLIDLLPIPALIAVALVVLAAWIVKESFGLTEYGGVLKHPYFQAALVLCAAGLVVYYALSFIFANEAPFRTGVRGILISKFTNDEKNTVQEQTAEALKLERDKDSSFADVQFRLLSREIPEGEEQKTIANANADGLVAGVLIPSPTPGAPTPVWYRWAWKGNSQIVRLQAPRYPDIDEFASKYMKQFVAIGRPVATERAAVQVATIEALTVENKRLQAELAQAKVPAPAPAKEFDELDKYALILGNGSYKNLPSLQYSRNDAEAFADTVLRAAEIPKSNVQLVIDGSRVVILNALEKFRDEVKPGARVYFYYSGHSFSSSGQSFIVPVDAGAESPDDTSISMSMIIRALSDTRAMSLAVFLDCDVDGELGQQVAEQGQELVVFSAGRTGQPAVEDLQLRHGMFTYYLLRGLGGEADLTRRGVVTSTELYGYLSAKIDAASHGLSKPEMKSRGAQELVLARSPTAATAPAASVSR